MPNLKQSVEIIAKSSLKEAGAELIENMREHGALGEAVVSISHAYGSFDGESQWTILVTSREGL